MDIEIIEVNRSFKCSSNNILIRPIHLKINLADEISSKIVKSYIRTIFTCPRDSFFAIYQSKDS